MTTLATIQRVLVTVVISTVVAGRAAAPQGEPPPRVLAYLDTAAGWIALTHPATGAERRIYRSGAAAVRGLTVAPGEGYLAFLEYGRGADQAASAEDVRLTVIDSSGNLVRSSPRVRRYEWCCGGGTLAAITGSAREGGGGFTPDGVLLLDVATGGQVAIIGVPSPRRLVWASFDSSLYIQSRGPARVYRYDMPGRRLIPTQHRDLFFSPEGRFYLHWADEEDPVTRLYTTAGDREVALPDSATLNALGGWRRDLDDHAEELRLVGWAFDRGNVLLFSRNRVIPIDNGPRNRLRVARREAIEHVLYDVVQRRIVRRFPGELSGASVPRGAIVIKAGGRINVLTTP